MIITSLNTMLKNYASSCMLAALPSSLSVVSSSLHMPGVLEKHHTLTLLSSRIVSLVTLVVTVSVGRDLFWAQVSLHNS